MPVVKGGVWTNIEDEILKASVSKYGLNQWARVSSLLARKTPKQCKARWNEWLDPTIKKTEWSKEEDEKLLHLAKLMPTQWRTIAPIVGRTANQCLERYQRLLDEAEQREESSLGLTGPDGGEAQAPSADDVRRLRPGEVDPDPETKPARPDTIDLDEDEKEMLSEARARLANTQGKKAKRKARERQQDESRRLASLQKRRELKTAGINIKVTTRKPGQMDYNADIPFEKKAVPGFYDTNEEISRNEYQRANFDPKKHQVGNKRKGEPDEDADRKRRKNDKDGPSASLQAALKAGQLQKLREAEQSSKRRALALPAPQVSDGELEEIVKMGMIGERANTLARESDNDATRGLVTSYSTLNSGAPIRTPMAPAQEDHIANEIRNIRALTQTTSSLLGGENTPLHEGVGSTGFDSVAPRRQVVSTPNPLATPLRSGAAGVGATPLHVGQTPLRTPRDSFALNASGDADMAIVGGTPNDARMRELSIRHQLKQGLASLPKPKETEWELELPEGDQPEVQTTEELEEDAAIRDRRDRELREARELLERKRRTQVMQRDLPRPVAVDYDALMQEATSSSKSSADPAESLIAREAALLVAHDAARYPLPGAPTANGSHSEFVDIPTIDDAALAQARLQILMESSIYQPQSEQMQAAWEKASKNKNALLLGLGCYDDDDDDESDRQVLATMQAALEETIDTVLESAEKGNKLEKKLNLHLGGYKKRAAGLRQKMGEAHDALETARSALAGFTVLQASEQAAIKRRLAALRVEVGFVSTREREAQDLYRRTKLELDELLASQPHQGTNGVAAVENGVTAGHY
ncbi:pre-mRNA splicing factor component-domain-containing protein [Lasiosphaeria ovina]|uniref:Pre-mRNA splicing factor component-domain-containing protein n=1 Tax=Lasiosphaeria ovina TaxID=92902 RepID=A0AAE0N8W5_9PEZI|nr:pre-mRNA splicing factor component-domain-containing protein [Lasiosphaeria ovina]